MVLSEKERDGLVGVLSEDGTIPAPEFSGNEDLQCVTWWSGLPHDVRPLKSTLGSSHSFLQKYPPTPAYSQSLGGEAPGTPQGEAVGQA